MTFVKNQTDVPGPWKMPLNSDLQCRHQVLVSQVFICKMDFMLTDINFWRIVDENPGLDLDKIYPISCRAISLVCRNKNHALLKSQFIHFQGALDMMKGLDYHHDNLIRIFNQLAEMNLLDPNQKVLHSEILHEGVAYLNRMGQFFYFVKSEFVKRHCPGGEEKLIPTIARNKDFRMKASAHRSLDAPHSESEHVRTTQAWSMSSISGHLHEPKPNVVRNMSNLKSDAESEAYFRRSWIDCYLVLQLITDDPNNVLNFSIEKEHPSIMQETYSVLEQLLK